nr:hypothetical protein [Corynebacterium sp. UBA5992]
MDWSLIIAAATLSTVPATIWLSREQLRHQRQYDQAQQVALMFQKVGTRVFTREGYAGEEVAIGLRYNGFKKLHGLNVSIVDGNEHTQIGPSQSLEPGESLGPMYLEILSSDLAGVHLHVAWQTPHPRPQHGGLRYQALRLGLEEELQEWRWLPFETVLRRLRLPVGYWHKVRKVPGDDKSFPGWPHGEPSSKADW